MTREDQLFIALQKCAGALAAIGRQIGEEAVINFTGEYADLGAMSLSQILDEANEALEEK